MRKMNLKPFTLLAMLLLISAVSGCASMIHGGKQTFEVQTTPSDAVVWINGYRAGRTPLPLTLRRNGLWLLRFEKPGYPAVHVPLVKGVDPWVAGNFLLTGGFPVGLAIDYATGAVYRLTPKQMERLQ
ncbi:PEGA domain-containing protein, partial [bacterium]|nr:PEGA domain-containing protein [bacterium]